MGQNDIIKADLADEILDDLGNATYIQGAFISEDLPAEDDPKTWFLKLIYYTNVLLWNRDYEQASWLKTGGTTIDALTGEPSPYIVDGAAVDYQGIIGADATQENYLRQFFDIPVGKVTFSGWFKMGASDSVQIWFPEVISHKLFIDLTTGAITAPDNIDESLVIVDGSDVFIAIEITTTQTNLNAYMFPSDGATTVVTGDGVTTDTFVQGLQCRNGLLADLFPTLPTTTVPVSAPAWVFEEKVAASGMFSDQAMYQHVEASGVTGDASVATTWTPLTLNDTPIAPSGSNISLAANVITLKKGFKYLIDANVAVYSSSTGQTRLYNITQTASALQGSSVSCSNADKTQSTSRLKGVIDLTAAGTDETFRLEGYSLLSHAEGYGLAVTSGEQEIYQQIEIKEYS
jgi:hypothetical protein